MSVGANDISVLLQDASGSPQLDAQVAVSATREGAAAGASEVRGQEGDADNKLLHSASIGLPAAGTWLIHVDVKHDAQTASLTFPAQEVVPTHGLDDWWPYFVFPAIGFLLLAIYSRRAHRRHSFAHDHSVEAAISR